MPDKKKPYMSITVDKPDLEYGMTESPYDALRETPPRPFFKVGAPNVKVDFPRKGLPPSSGTVESLYGLPEEGDRPAPGDPNRSAIRAPEGGRDEGARRPPGKPNLPSPGQPSLPSPGRRNLPEERIPARPVTPNLPAEDGFPFQRNAPPVTAMRGVPPGAPAEDTVSPPESRGPGLPVPKGMAPPAPESSIKKWWGGLPPEQRSAIQRSLLVTGLSLMARQQPSKYPISPVAQLGQAGLDGVSSYDQSMDANAKSARHSAEMGLRERHLGVDEARLRMAVDEAMRKAEMESPGTEETVRPNTYLPPMGETGEARNRLNLGPGLKTGMYAGPRGLPLSSDTAVPRGANGLPSLNTETVTVPARPAGIDYQKKQAEIRRIEAETQRSKAETKKVNTVAEKEPRDFIKEKALDAANKAASKVLEFSQGDPEAAERANEVANGIYQTSVHLQMGHKFVPGTPGKPGVSHFFSPDEPEQPPVPGHWVDASGKPVDGSGGAGLPTGGGLPEGLPPGSKQIGTSGGKPVYEAPDGRKFIVE